MPIGKASPFPPLPGQPYPPVRKHPRWREIYRLHDEWMMKFWPFLQEKKRARIPPMRFAGFAALCAPAGDFEKMVWAGRITGVFFMTDDYMDNGKQLDRIEGFKQACTGDGPLHPNDRAELCHDIVFRAIKDTTHPRTFKQLVKCTHEWLESHVEDPPVSTVEEYFEMRRVNIAMFLINAYLRYCLDVHLKDEHVNHPLMREAEGIVGDHITLTNDYFSYAKERLTDTDNLNLIRVLQMTKGMTYEEAMEDVRRRVVEKEQEFIQAGMAVLNHPEMGQDPEVRRWIQFLPYAMGGNQAWSQETARYNIDGVPGAIPFPYLAGQDEPVPEDEVVQDEDYDCGYTGYFPPPDFTLDTDPIETNDGNIIVSRSALRPWLFTTIPVPERPVEVGIIALHIARTGTVNNDISSALADYGLEATKVQKIEIVGNFYVFDVQSFCAKNEADIGRGNTSVVQAIFGAKDWIEGASWDGGIALIIHGSALIAVGSNAPLTIKPNRGTFTDITNSVNPTQALENTYSNYIFKREKRISMPRASINDLDYLVYAGISVEDKLKKEEVKHQIVPFCFGDICSDTGVADGIATIIAKVPAYDLFEKHIGIFEHIPGGTSSYFEIRVMHHITKNHYALKEIMSCNARAN